MGQRRSYLACGSGGSRSQAGALPGGWLISWPGLAILANSARSQPDGQTLLVRPPVAKPSLCRGRSQRIS